MPLCPLLGSTELDDIPMILIYLAVIRTIRVPAEGTRRNQSSISHPYLLQPSGVDLLYTNTIGGDYLYLDLEGYRLFAPTPYVARPTQIPKEPAIDIFLQPSLPHVLEALESGLAFFYHLFVDGNCFLRDGIP